MEYNSKGTYKHRQFLKLKLKEISMKRKTFDYKGHQTKEREYILALLSAGYKNVKVAHGLKPSLVLVDMDTGARREFLQKCYEEGIPSFLYPHAARPQIIWDGIYEPYPYAKACFVQSPGHKEIMERYGYNVPIEVTGWTYCKIFPFNPVTEIKSILFGPIHPSAKGWMADEDLDANKKTFEFLIEYCKDNNIQLKVRYIKELEQNGLWKVDGVNFIQGHTNLAIDEINNSDVIIGHQTFAYLAIASGKPTLMMREDIPPHTIKDGNTVYATSWEKYKDIMAYPLDILKDNPEKEILNACSGTEDSLAWKERFLSTPWNPEYFIERIESYL